MAYLDNVTNILQIQPDGLPTYVRLSQNENGRNLYFELQGNEADIPANATITISGTKPDGVVYSGTGSCTDNVVLIPETVQMTAVAGTWDAKIQITSGGNTIATGRVRFVVDADTVAPGSVPSDSELEGLVAQAQQYAETARTEAYGSPLTASTAASMTDHTRVYVYTGSESGYTAGHWYFWNGSAWTDGGIYNSVAVNTDPTLKLSGVAADAKATGDAIAAVTIETDKTLSVSDAPADAKVVGDEIASLKGDLSDVNDRIGNLSNLETEDKTNIVSAINEAARSGITDEVKVALLACFAKVAWINGHGQDYYDALENALYPSDYPKIVASLNSGINVFYTDDSLSDVKDHITVKYYDEEGSSGVVVPSLSYELTGTLVEGSSVLTITYNELSTTVVVSVYSDAVPTGYTAYDYISTSWSDTSNPFSRSSDALIGFGPYENVNHVSIRTDIFPTHNILSAHAAIFGVKSNASSGAYGAGVSLYGRGSDSAYIVYTHTNSETIFTNAFTKNAINHVEIIVNDESPSTFIAGDVEHEISWERDDSLSGPIYLFINQYPNFTGTIWLTRYFQLGKTEIIDADGTVDVYVPVLRTADNVVGLYNTTKGIFITCADTKYATVGDSDCAYKVGNWS